MHVIEQLYAHRNAGDRAGAMALFSPDVVYHDQSRGLTLTGQAEVEAFFARSEQTIEDLGFEVTMAVETDDRFAAELWMRGVLPEPEPGTEGTAGPFALPYAALGDKRDGRISRLVEYYDAADFSPTSTRRPPPEPDR